MKSLRTQAKGVAHRLLLNPNVRKLTQKLLLNPNVRKLTLTQKLPFLRDHLGGLHRSHPFDQIYGVDIQAASSRQDYSKQRM